MTWTLVLIFLFHLQGLCSTLYFSLLDMLNDPPPHFPCLSLSSSPLPPKLFILLPIILVHGPRRFKPSECRKKQKQQFLFDHSMSELRNLELKTGSWSHCPWYNIVPHMLTCYQPKARQKGAAETEFKHYKLGKCPKVNSLKKGLGYTWTKFAQPTSMELPKAIHHQAFGGCFGMSLWWLLRAQLLMAALVSLWWLLYIGPLMAVLHWGPDGCYALSLWRPRNLSLW